MKGFAAFALATLFGSMGASAALPPYAQITDGDNGLVDTCSASNVPVSVDGTVNVPAGTSYQYFVYGISDPSNDPPDPSKGPYAPVGSGTLTLLYKSPVLTGPVTLNAGRLVLGTPADWYSSATPSLPAGSTIQVQILAYPTASGTGTPTANSTISWGCTAGNVIFVGNGGNAVGFAGGGNDSAIEFFNNTSKLYFMSTDPAEIAALDSGAIAGWARTGQSFAVFTSAVFGSSPVCRYYFPSTGAHFYSASPAECAAIPAIVPGAILETASAFYVDLPDGSGACPANTIAVYRLFDGRADLGHRYTDSMSIRNQMIAQGYILEGSGAGANMCVPN